MARMTESPSTEPATWRHPAAASGGHGLLPRIPPGIPWYFATYAHRWVADVEIGEIVPDLITVSATPGVCDVGAELRTPGSYGMGSMGMAWARMAERGLRPVDPDEYERRAGAPYIYPVDVPGGKAWLDASQRAIPGSEITTVDPEARRLMLLTIRDMVPPPEPHVLEAMRARLERDHAAAYADADRDPRAARRRDHIAQQIAMIDAALALEAEPSPPTARRRKTAEE